MLLQLLPCNMLVSSLVPVDDPDHVAVALFLKLESQLLLTLLVLLALTRRLLLLLSPRLQQPLVHRHVELLAETLVRLVAIVDQSLGGHRLQGYPDLLPLLAL